MKRTSVVLLAVALVLTAVGLALAAEKSAEKSQVFYVCNCGAVCHCDSLSKEPGKCTCGKDMAAMHLLAIEKDTAIFCTCGGNCSCERSKTDPDKCDCGNPVKKVSLKGKYVCACGADCTCGSISDKPGKCTCGQEMKKVL